MQTTVWAFTIRLTLHLNPDINERTASNFMIYSFIAFFVGKFIANLLITKYSSSKILVVYATLGSVFLAYVAFVPNMTAVYAAIVVSFLFGPCWATIFAETLAEVDEEYTEVAGAVLVMAIVGGAVIPAVQGLVSDSLGNMQYAFIVSMLCFMYIGFYFYGKRETKKSIEEDIQKFIS